MIVTEVDLFTLCKQIENGIAPLSKLVASIYFTAITFLVCCFVIDVKFPFNLAIMFSYLARSRSLFEKLIKIF